jgi:MFS family permease
VALSNVTLGVLLATLDGSIVLIAMPDIFRGIHLDPLVPANSFYLLWMILGFLVVTSVLIVSLGRLGDMYGRVRMYNLGFAVYTLASLLLTVDWMTGRSGAIYLIAFRVVQGIGAAFLLANAAAILTDAFPANQRGMALGINNIVGVSGMFVGLVLGGLLAPVDWRLVFLISVPVGLFGTVWAYLKLEERSTPKRARVDWWGNVTFALGLILIMVSVTYGIRPYGSHATGWSSPRVLGLLGAGAAFLVAFAIVELRVAEPMFRLPLFRIRAFTFGTLSTFLSAVSRGGLMFMLIIWLQGIWLPQHGYDFTETPLWAGIYMLPLTLGMLVAGPTSGYLSDRFGARWFATGGDARLRARVLPADAAADRLPVPAVRARARDGRRLDGHVRLAEPRRGDEQPAATAPRRRRRDEPDLPELGAGALDRRVLHAHDPRAGHEPAAHALGGAAGARRLGRRGERRCPHPAGVRPVRRLSRLQPGRTPGRVARARLAVDRQPRDARRPLVLPAPDLRPLPHRAARGVPVRDRRLPDRRGDLADARRHVSLCRAGAGAAHVGRCAGHWRRRERRRELRSRRRERRARARNCYYDSGGASACELSGTASRPFT